jgi:peptidyl-prolyl cis-trans isomerase D
MLDLFRRGAGGILVKTLMALLALSFVLWGITGSFTGFGLGTLAKVGNREIDVDEFRRNLSNVLDNVAQLTRRRPTPDEVRQRGFDRRVLDDMISMAAIDNNARELGLALSPETITQNVHKDPAFTGPDGSFNIGQFRNQIGQTGYTEREYLAQRQREEVRELLSQSMFGNLPTSKALIDLVNRFNGETRVVEYFTIDPSKVTAPGDPDDAKLKPVYEQNLRKLVAPEYRSATIVLLTRESIRKGISVDDARVAAEYERLKARMEVPEKRRIQQISFPNRAAAETAAKEIAGGKSFLDVAKERGAKETDVELGLLARADLLDPKIADAAFALPKDKVSDPVDGRYGSVLLRVTEINEGRMRPLDEVKGEITDRLAIEEATSRINKLHDAVDEDRLEGKTPAEIATRHPEVQVVTIEATDRNNKTPEGATALDNPDASIIVQAVFDRRPGTDSEAVNLSNGGYAWFDLGKITPERQRTFEETKDEVTKIWRDQETANAINEYATKLVDRATKGEALTTLATDAGGKVETSSAFNRQGQGASLPQGVYTRAFTVPKGGVVSAPNAEGTSRIVFRVTEVKSAPPPSKEESERIAGVLRDGLRNDLFTSYVNELRARYGVYINEAVLRGTAGGVDQ